MHTMREDSARPGAGGAPPQDPASSIGRAWWGPPLIAAFGVAAMGFVALALDLPIRDPDARYVGSPLALIGVIAAVFVALDVVPRALRSRSQGGSTLAALAGVFNARWLGKRGAIVLVSLLSFYATYLAYRNLKSFLPFAVSGDHDLVLLDLERTLLFGQDPATLLQTLLGTGVAAHGLSVVYLSFLTFVPVSLGVALIWSSNLRAGLWYVTALSLCWMLGAASYFAVPAQGPIYAKPALFYGLPETGVSRLQETLAGHRAEVLADPAATTAVQSVAAFASLHIAVVFAAALIAQLLGVRRGYRIALWAYLGLTALATVYFGWHYVVDDVAGLLIGGFAVVAAAWATGFELRPRTAPSLAHTSARAT